MSAYARPNTRFSYVAANAFANDKTNREVWRPPHFVSRDEILMSIVYLVRQGWLKGVRRKSDYVQYFRFSPAGVTRWETVERAKFEATCTKCIAKLMERDWVTAIAEAEERKTKEIAEAERLRMREELLAMKANLKRFGVTWDVHEQLREEGKSEWDE